MNAAAARRKVAGPPFPRTENQGMIWRVVHLAAALAGDRLSINLLTWKVGARERLIRSPQRLKPVLVDACFADGLKAIPFKTTPDQSFPARTSSEGVSPAAGLR